MVQNFQTRLATNLAITSGTILTPDQYQLTATRTQPTLFSGSLLNVPEGSRDIGVGDSQLYMRVRITENFDQAGTLLEIIPVYSPTTDLGDALALDMYRARFPGGLLRANLTLHLPLRPISAGEALNGIGTPIWPTQLQYVGCKFIVSGTAFATGRVQVDITPHVSPDATTTLFGVTIHPKLPLAGW